MTPYYADDQVTLYHGDALDVLRTLPDGSVDCVVTSPPYYGLRDYGEPGQYGLEASPAEYVETMRRVFAEVRRVLAADGTLWLNLGDTYDAGGNYARKNPGSLKDGTGQQWNNSAGRTGGWLGPKQLMGMPWRVALALQDDGWILRSDVIWHKVNAMPESVTDRPAKTHEHVFLFAKSVRYHFDLDAIREPHPPQSLASADRKARIRVPYHAPGQTPHSPVRPNNERGANPGDVWALPNQPFAEAHFAVMVPECARRCVVAGCKPGGVVLDPFCGSGTTGMVALRHGRRFVGIDLSAKYLDLALRTRLAQTAIIDEPALAGSTPDTGSTT